jgi:hypothetical protein
MTDPEKTEQQKTDKQKCEHDWQYSVLNHRHECSKCGIPAPPDWNEVPFI